MPDPTDSTVAKPAEPAPPPAPTGPPSQPGVAPPQTVAPPPAVSAATPPSFDPRWAGPGRGAPAAALVATGVTGLVGAAALTWDRPGIGWWITALTATVAIGLVVRGNAAGRHPGRTATAMWALASLALTGVGAVRAAEWLFVLCLLTAAVVGCVAVAGGRSVPGLILGVMVTPVAVVRAMPWVARGAAASRGRVGSGLRTAAAVLVGVALLAVFGSLFASADAAFGAVLDRILPTVDAAVLSRWVFTFGFVALGVLGACFLALAPPAFDGGQVADGERTPRRSLRRLEWALPIGGLVGLFLAFVTVQATVLFGGGDYVLRTTGLTYAEYARSGFWQLVAVSVLTLMVIGITAKMAARESVADRAWLRVLLGTLTTLSLMIVVSAMSRMWAYEQAYGFTRLRLLVSVFEILLGCVFVLVIVAGIRLRRRAIWLPRAILFTAVLALIGIAGLNPDRFIAERNVTRFAETHRIDVSYLSTLSADAVPALDRLPEPWRSCALGDLHRRLAESASDEEWRHWNLGRHQARRILADFTSPYSDRSSACSSLSSS